MPRVVGSGGGPAGEHKEQHVRRRGSGVPALLLLGVAGPAARNGPRGSGLEGVNAQMLQLSRPNANEFFEVYKGVVPECVDWINELVSGKVVALQVRSSAKPEEPVLAVRELCGVEASGCGFRHRGWRLCKPVQMRLDLPQRWEVED